MKLSLSSITKVFLAIVGSIFASGKVALSQVTPDSTNINTQVNQNGNVAEITGGQTRGGNLFHSFGDFSVPTDNEAFFNNANDISNIFSRVTGGNISNIDGAIRANGSANLFLINPAGIIFSENARLDIGGSFYGSTASSILFEDGEFSAADLENPPLLTVNAPIGLGFRDNPGDIVNRSRVENSSEEVVGLEVDSGNNLAFVGGNLNFEAGNATARGGNIYLGGLSQAGQVSFNEDGSLSFPEDITKANVSLTNAAKIDVAGNSEGNIAIDALNLNIAAGELGESTIQGGIGANFPVTEAQAGDIKIDVTENITIDGGDLKNQVDSEGIGNSGDIIINTGSLEVLNDSEISTTTRGKGDAGDINITARENINVEGESSLGFGATINSTSRDPILFAEPSENSAGNITISTANLNLTNGGEIEASALGLENSGNSGSINISASDNINIDGATSSFFPSGIISDVKFGEGDAGEINVSSNNLSLTNGGTISTSIGLFSEEGNAGNINITVAGNITIDGETGLGNSSSIQSSLGSDAEEGDAGSINITANNLILTNKGRVNVNTSGKGNAGNIDITTTEDITITGGDLEFPSIISSEVTSIAEGNGGSVTLSAKNLTVTEGGIVSATTKGKGDAGTVNINATENIVFDGANTFGRLSSAISEVDSSAEGNAGGVNISTSNLNLTDGGTVSSRTLGKGNAGNVDITATDTITVDGGAENTTGFDGEFVPGRSSSINNEVGVPNSDADFDAEGNGGELDISTTNLVLTGGRISARTNATGDAGKIGITATGDITIDRGGISSDGLFTGTGNGGEIVVSANNLTLTNAGSITTIASNSANAGSIDIFATGDITVDGQGLSLPSQISSQATGDEGNAGRIGITAKNLSLINSGIINAGISSSGGVAGDITINATESILIQGSKSLTGFVQRFRSGIFSDAVFKNGDGGNINVFTSQLTIKDSGGIEASNFPDLINAEPGTGQPGNITITADSIDLVNEARINTATRSETGISGIINLKVADKITLRDDSQISAEARETGNGGNLNIDTNFIIAFPNGNNDIIASAEQGQGGNINISAEALLGIEERPLNDSTNDINASSEFSLDGSITIDTPDVNPAQGVTELPTNIVVPEETATQACQANRETAANNRLNVRGKGGITPAPDLPLNSLNVTIGQIEEDDDRNNNSTSATPKAIETSVGKVQPAKGIKVSESGEVILTAYRTNNSGARLPKEKLNCGG